MTDQPDSRLRPTRRQTLGGTAGLIAAALGIDPSTAEEAIDATGGSLMALQEATNVAGDLFIGPDSAKSSVTPETGRVYKAVDSGAEYYGDGSSWTKQPVEAPAIRTEELRGGVTGGLSVGTIFGERISSQTISNSDIEITNGLTADFDRYILDLTDVVVNADPESMYLQVSVDGGATWTETTDYSFVVEQLTTASASGIFSKTQNTTIELNNDGIGGQAGEGLNVTISLRNPASAQTNKMIEWAGSMINNGGGFRRFHGAGVYLNSEAYDAVRIVGANDVFAHAKVDLYGVMS